MRPLPFSPQACAPSPGPSSTTPSLRSSCTLRCVAGFDHISTFMAGAASSGQVRASTSVDSRSSASPCAVLARKWADAGATTIASAPRVRSMCGIALSTRPPSSPHWSVNTGWPDSACIVVGVTNSCAARVITTRTDAPASRSRRTSSQAL